MKNGITISNDIIIEMSKMLDTQQLEQLSSCLAQNLEDAVILEDNKFCDTMEKTWDAFNDFINFKKTYQASQRTINTYSVCIRGFLVYANTPLLYIDNESIRSYLQLKLNTCKQVSVNNIRRDLSSFFTWCYDFNYILKNPCTKNKVPIIKEPQTIRHDITPLDVLKLKDEAHNIENKLKRTRCIALLDFVESTGCRVEEVRNAKIEDLNIQENKLKIWGKGSKERIVFLNQACCKHLEEYLQYKCDINMQDEYIFSNLTYGRLHKPINEHLVEDITKDLGKVVGIENLTIHIFRRYFATSCYKKGMDLDTIRKLMGHSDCTTTLSYINSDIEFMRNSYNKVAY